MNTITRFFTSAFQQQSNF